jgi:hypothetical protein
MLGDKNAVPIRLDIVDTAFSAVLEKNTGRKQSRWALILDGINTGKIRITNPNRESHRQEQFFLEDMTGKQILNPKYVLKTIRACNKDSKPENYRFDSYIDATKQIRGYGQSNSEGEFSVDLNFVEYIKNDVSIPRDIGFISYAFKEKDIE